MKKSKIVLPHLATEQSNSRQFAQTSEVNFHDLRTTRYQEQVSLYSNKSIIHDDPVIMGMCFNCLCELFEMVHEEGVLRMDINLFKMRRTDVSTEQHLVRL